MYVRMYIWCTCMHQYYYTHTKKGAPVCECKGTETPIRFLVPSRLALDGVKQMQFISLFLLFYYYGIVLYTQSNTYVYTYTYHPSIDSYGRNSLKGKPSFQILLSSFFFFFLKRFTFSILNATRTFGIITRCAINMRSDRKFQWMYCRSSILLLRLIRPWLWFWTVDFWFTRLILISSFSFFLSASARCAWLAKSGNYVSVITHFHHSLSFRLSIRLRTSCVHTYTCLWAYVDIHVILRVQQCMKYVHYSSIDIYPRLMRRIVVCIVSEYIHAWRTGALFGDVCFTCTVYTGRQMKTNKWATEISVRTPSTMSKPK